jgi:UPF0755 protein
MATKRSESSSYWGSIDQLGDGSRGPEGGGPKRRSSRTTAVVVSGFVLFAVLVFGALGFAVKWYNSHSTDTTVSAAANGSLVVDITGGMTASQIATLLQEQGIISNTVDFLALITQHGTENKLQPGRYTFPAGLNLADIVDMLEQGTGSARYKLTIAEGKAVSQIKDQLDKDGKVSGSEYSDMTAQLATFELPYLAGVQVTGVSTLEGLLFPSTYFLSEGQSAAELIKQQLLAFTNMTASLPWSDASALKVTPYQVVIIASIIEKECRVPDERAKVARVIYNRLAINMPLQIDATVRFAVNKWTGALTSGDLATRSAYNTYLNKGLPPAPICNPGAATLRAALEPVDGDWLYYVLKDTTGNHFFTSSYEEFLQAKANQPTE